MKDDFFENLQVAEISVSPEGVNAHVLFTNAILKTKELEK